MNDLEILRSQYPRVSEILGRQTIEELRKIPLEVLANACIRGNKVHSYCITYIQGLFLADIELAYRPYVEAFIAWYDENVQKLLKVSERLYDDQNRFTGEFDFIAQLKSGEVALIDIKTSYSYSKTWPLQLAAYDHLCKLNGFKVERIFNLHLKKEKEKIYQKIHIDEQVPPDFSVEPKIYDCVDVIEAWEIFKSALKCYNFFEIKEAYHVSL